MGLLDGRAAVVYGGSGKLGSHIARALYAQGARVAVHYHGNAEKARALAESLDPRGERAVAAQGDVTDEASLNRLVNEVKEHFGSLDVVVNTVHAPFEPKFVADMGREDWKLHTDALLGHFLVCKTALPVMRAQQRGRIVFVSAALAVRYAGGCSAYTAVKRGLDGFCRTLAKEEGKHNILVNVVAPGGVSDSVSEGGGEWDDMTKMLLANCALGRFATSEEVANAVVYFASPLADGITGQTIYVSGGEIMI
jgi:3-oxoacyl-[acyl-carrier protein] reductase